MYRKDNKIYFKLNELCCVLDLLMLFRDTNNPLYKRVCNLINYYGRTLHDSLDTEYSIDIPSQENHSLDYKICVNHPIQCEFDFDYVH